METHLTREQRWEKAGQMQQFYNKHYGTDVSKSAFYKSDNPLTQKVVKYEITYGFNHKGNSKRLGGSYEFYLEQQTEVVYALSDVETDEVIKEKIASSVSEKFKGGANNWFYSELMSGSNIEVVRVVERNDVEFKEIDTSKIAISHDQYSQNLSTKAKLHSVRNGKDKPYDLDLTIYL